MGDKSKLSESWDRMLRQRVDQTMGAVSKGGKSQHDDQKTNKRFQQVASLKNQQQIQRTIYVVLRDFLWSNARSLVFVTHDTN
jgi:hypothetical protein